MPPSPASLHELLAPAGSFEAALAAFTYGADAIYLGLQRFSARADATNFSDDDLRRIVAYARNLPRPRKVYITLNTLLESREFAELPSALALLSELAVDGVIVQDLGVAAFIRRTAPALPLHASTQLACTSQAHARALKALGFVRIVPARELTLEEAAEIGQRVGIEVEVFVHGALCYSLSGLCLYSSLTTGRSGNRGRCAYCCRQRLRPDGAEPCHPFSMRDLALAPLAEALRTLPLASYKIEGRMKSPLYVAAVTDLYRHALDGTLTPAAFDAKAEALRTIFSRPWTELYARQPTAPAEAVIDPLCVGHRGTPIGRVRRVVRELDGRRFLHFESTRAIERHDGLQIDLPGRPLGFAVGTLRDGRTKRPAITLPAGSRVEVELPREVGDLPIGATVYCSASQAVRRAFPVPKPRASELRRLQGVDLTLTLAPDALTLSGLGITRTQPATLAPAKDPERSASAARELLGRLGEHGFALRSLTLHNPGGLFLPASLLNALRRTWAAAAIEAAHAVPPPAPAPIESAPARNPATRCIRSLKVAACQQPEALGLTRALPEGEVIVTLTAQSTLAELEPWRALVPPERLRIALPLALRSADLGPVAALVGALADRAQRKFEAPDLGAWQLLRDLQPACDAFDLSADWSWYAANAHAARLQAALGITRAVSGPEANLPNLRSLPLAPEHEVLAAQFAPLFIAYNRPCAPEVPLTGRNGERLHITRLGALWITFDERPWALTPAQCHALREAGFERLRLDLSWAGAALEPLDWQRFGAGATLPNHFDSPRL